MNEVINSMLKNMTLDHWLFLMVSIFGLISIIGFFFTKAKGYGVFTASTFLIILVLTFSSLMYAAGKINSNEIANIFFAVLGFVGGLVTAKKGTEG